MVHCIMLPFIAKIVLRLRFLNDKSAFAYDFRQTIPIIGCSM